MMKMTSVSFRVTDQSGTRLEGIAEQLSKLVQLMSPADMRIATATDARVGRGDVASHDLAEMEAVIEAAFAYADFFTVPLLARKRYAAIRQ